MGQNATDFLPNIMLNIISNALTSLIAKSAKEIKEMIRGGETLEKQNSETSFHGLLHDALNDLDERISLQPSKGRDILSSFLQSPEVEEITRQIYSTVFVEDKVQSNLQSIRKSFVTLIVQYFATYPSDTSLKPDQLVAIAHPLFEAIVKGCNYVFDSAIEVGILSAKEAKDTFRYNVLQSQIAAIEKELELLSGSHKMNIKEILEFEKQYRKQVGKRHGHITPPNLRSAQPRSINDLYVYPRFIVDSDREKEQKQIKKDEFTSRMYRAVVLGNPGAGKSTLALKLCYDLTHNSSERLLAGRQGLTPIFVILRNYGVEKKERKYSILDFIESEVRATYQLSTPPYNTFPYLLLTGRTVVIFDGLDELLDTSYRQEIRDDVQLFCSLYPSVPILITSRLIGYEQAPLDKSMFEVFRIDDFDEDQIVEYAKKWFKVVDTQLTVDQRQAKARAFLQDSELVQDLRRNPLMLSLLCTIYREEHYIPRYRPDVYEKCALMLFEQWDKSRNIYDPPLPEEHIRPLLEYLADWIFNNEHLRTGATEEELANKTTNYLYEWIYENRHKAERTAQKFISFCTGRAWVFTDTGTKREGESLYQFAHTTFLEYFAASYLVRSCPTPKSLLKILLPKILKREWDVISQLTFQLQHKKNVGAGDVLLKTLVEQALKRKDNKKWNLLSFAIRTLQFIVPRPEVRQYITRAYIQELVSWGCKQIERQNSPKSEDIVSNNISAILKDLLIAIPENSTTIGDTLHDLLVGLIKGDSEPKAIVALHMTLMISWNGGNIASQIFEDCTDQLEYFYPRSLALGYDAVWNREISILDLIKWYGFEGLFIGADTLFGPAYSPIFSLLLSDTFTLEKHSFSSKNILKILKELGKFLLSYPPPWWNKLETKIIYPSYLIKDGLDNECLFGIFALAAMSLESNKYNNKNVWQSQVKALEKLSVDNFYLIILARFDSLFLGKVQEGLDKNGFTVKQQHFIWRWVRKEISLIDPDFIVEKSNLIQPFTHLWD